MAIALAGKVKPLRRWNPEQQLLHFSSVWTAIALAGPAVEIVKRPPLVEGHARLKKEKPASIPKCPENSALMREKVAFLKKAEAIKPGIFCSTGQSENGQALANDLKHLLDLYAEELNRSLGPLNGYPVGKSMQDILQNKALTTRSVDSLRNMSRKLMMMVRESSKYDSQQRRCAGEAVTLSMLVRGIYHMKSFVERNDPLQAIAIYRKLVPEKNGEGKIRKNISGASKLVMKDKNFFLFAEGFISECISVASKGLNGNGFASAHFF